ncbi:YjbR protein [Asanoa ishikariensis]|uniref:YjbR protein n=1 Tax=Asanoa ishikariensis TaxID=137265 RepID=A0A1H3QJW1_9ACTN|nr:MmcQ/YjbR family DNA-binding protein [Asanoa ishikariensis]SDZ13391.1 YjbR protein [Asanoa ishikariensis]
MSAPGDVPPAILARLRAICRGLPEAYEEPAWIGVRWRIRQRTIAHVYTRDQDRTGPLVVMTFRAADDEVAAFASGGPPFFRAEWGGNVVGITFGRRTDWVEVGELLTESYRIMAPKKLAALLPEPPG